VGHARTPPGAHRGARLHGREAPAQGAPPAARAPGSKPRVGAEEGGSAADRASDPRAQPTGAARAGRIAGRGCGWLVGAAEGPRRW
jgi:hypothetical protein